MKKKIPIGTSNYRELRIHDYYTVDKSLMIQDFLELGTKVTLITRPRRFGKTLNMSMMAELFDITKDSKALFEGLAIMDTEYAKEMNQYPTIFISFADCKGKKEFLLEFLFDELQTIYEKYEDLFDSEQIGKGLRERIQKNYEQLKDRDSIVKVVGSLKTLTEFLSSYYKQNVMLLIDEYDTPFIEAHIHGYYDDIHDIFSGILRMVLKDNEYLQYAMLTGIQRIAKENIFSDLNNLKVYGVTSQAYAQYFGFTKEETQKILNDYDLEYSDVVKQMYDGYRMGNVDIYNPWSIINYAQEGKLEPYWVNTSGNKMIKSAMEKSDLAFKEGYEELIGQGHLDTQINMGTSFYEQADTESLWGLFVNAGYLTIEAEIRMDKYRIRIPNNEVRKEFKSLTAHYLQIADTTLTNLFSALEDKNEKKFIQTYESILLRMPSFHDLNNENSYQAPWPAVRMMMLGMCAWLQNDYEIISNREEGKGRCDIVLSSKKNFLPSFVIEFKYMKKVDYERNPNSLKELANEAINQIKQNKYDAELTGEVILIGLAHAGKDVEMEWVEK